ncbi:MAG TPA: hypothetical protein VF606_02090 [Geminicoccaceae bacterium]
MGTTRRALELLARVERRELDRERLAVAAVVAEVEAARAELGRLDTRFGEELDLAFGLPDGPRLAAAYAHGHRARRAETVAEGVRLGTELVRLEAALKERAVSLKTLELAAERIAAREREEAARAGQARLDEAAVLRHVVSGRG